MAAKILDNRLLIIAILLSVISEGAPATVAPVDAMPRGDRPDDVEVTEADGAANTTETPTSEPTITTPAMHMGGSNGTAPCHWIDLPILFPVMILFLALL